MRVFTIAKRVSKEFFRDKRTLAMMFIAPIFIMWLMSIVFSASTTTNISVASVNTPNNVVEIMQKVENVNLEQFQTKEEADKKIKNYINQEKDLEAQLFVALSEESGLSYQEMKELILPAQSSN